MMPEEESRKLWYVVYGDSAPPSSLDISCHHDIDTLKHLINARRNEIPVSDMVLWKLNSPILLDETSETLAFTEKIREIQFPDLNSDEAFQGTGEFQRLVTDRHVSSYWTEKPKPSHLHLIVQISSVKSPAKRPRLEEDFDRIYVPREETVSSLYKKVQQEGWVHVQGTPGSGKSVLAGLLNRYIKEKEPDTQVVFRSAWPENQPVQTTPGTILILDEAQTTYGDKDFWMRFKNPGLQDVRVIAFACHGSTGYTGADPLTPIWIGLRQRVSLVPLDCGDGISVGLLFTREEFNAFVQLRYNNRRFSDSFLDCIFDMTNGHVGACEAVMQTVITHESYRRLEQTAEYTHEMFIAGVSMADLLKGICRWSVFARGLPSTTILRENGSITAVFDEVIATGGIVCPDDYLVSNPKDDDDRKAALRTIFRAGWLHTEIGPDIDGVFYMFPSPLHMRCIDWMLNGLPAESRITKSSLSEFALAVVKGFSSESLGKRQMGPKAQSILEAQFQDEFYRVSFKHAKGPISFPELGTKKGRIDFFIQSKKWGVELLRDGNRLVNHARRFTEGEYSRWIEEGWMSDYIILDFCTRHPRICQDLDKLYYVVSVDDWKTIEILDSERSVVGQYSLLASDDIRVLC